MATVAQENTLEKEPVATFFRKRKGAGKSNVRKRATSDDDDNDDDDSRQSKKSAVIKVDKKASANPLVQGTGKRTKRNNTTVNQDDSSDNDDDDEHGVGVKFGDKGRNPESRSASPDPKTTSTKPEQSKADGLYHGAKSYSSQLPTGSARYGAIKGPANVRTITLVDYQPDVCKDYKETGFCGFGDTCKFLHDRGDYLHGWQMENNFLSQPFQQSRSGQQQPDETETKDQDEDQEDLPFACLICRQPFTDPVETKCGHFFCSSCAIKRYGKTPKCFACGTATGGIFNAAKKIIDRQKKIDEANQADGALDSGNDDPLLEIKSTAKS